MLLDSLTMVSFFKTAGPIEYTEKRVRVEGTGAERELVVAEQDEGDLASPCESAIGVEYGYGPKYPVVQVNRLGGSGYLFSGHVEIHRVGEGESRSLEPGLRLVIRKYTGEWVGTVIYGDVVSRGRRFVDVERKEVIRSVYHIRDEKYLVYVNYGEDYVVLRMELCPGDEDILGEIIRKYGGA